MLNKTVDVHRVATLSDEINFITQHFNKNTVFSTLIYLDEAYYFDKFNNIRKVFIRIDRDMIHILKESSSGIIISAGLKNLKFIYIYDVAPIVKSHAELCNIRLVFGCGEYETDLRLYFKKREELISTLITIRRITKNYINEIRFLLQDLESFEKYYIVMPCSFIIDDYEASIVKEMAGMLKESKVYEPALFQLLDEIMMNCKFSNLTKVDPQLIQRLGEFVPFVYRNMLVRSYEEKDRCLAIKANLDTELMREICTKNQEISKAEGFRYFKFLYSKLLNFLRLLSNSKAYYRDLAMQKELLKILLESLNFDDTFISSQASQMLASLITFSNMPSNKMEKPNKDRLLAPDLDLIGHVKRLLAKCDLMLEKNSKDLKVLEINGAFLLLFLFIKDDVSSQYDYVNSFDKVIADAILGEDKSLFHYLDKLALRGLFSVSFGATILINKALEYYQRSPNEEDRRKEEQCKEYVMNYSVQFIWNIYMLMRCSFEEQVEESLSFVSNILYKNKQAVKLITRMFQKSLFNKVGKADELFKSYTWTRLEWQEFFQKLKKNYNTSTEQWNKQTRSELYDCIIKEIDDYLFFQKEYKNSNSKNKLMHPCFKYDNQGRVISSVEHIKWNSEEFEVDYPSLKNLHKVGKYFLAVLLNERPVTPYLIEVITSPITLWNELNTKFHCADSKEEQMYIIKVLIAMYQKHFQMLKEMKTIPFWVKALANEKHFQLHFWILQLLYVALSIPFGEYAHANFKMFKKANGLTALFGILNSTFKELAPPDMYDMEEEKSDHFNAKIANFTGIKENLYCFERNTMHINKSILVINILDELYSLMGDANQVPLPSFAQYLSKKRSINVLTQLFIIENVDLNKALINFILKNCESHYALTSFLDNGIVEALILTLHTKNGRKA